MGRFQLPLARDAPDSLAGASIFSTTDVSSGFWHIEVHPNSREKTAFIIRNGLYCDVRIDYFRIRRLMSYILTKTPKRVKLFWYHRLLLSLLF